MQENQYRVIRIAQSAKFKITVGPDMSFIFNLMPNF